MDQRPRYLYLALVGAVVALSFAAILVKFSSSDPLVLAVYRLLLSSVMLLPWVVGELNRRGWSLSGKELSFASVSGLFLGFHYALWFSSLNKTSVASSTVLVTIHPLMVVPISSWLWGERVGSKSWVGLAIAIVGSTILVSGDLALEADRLVGDVEALLSAGAIAVYFFIGASLRKAMDLFTYSGLVYASGALSLYVVGKIWGVSFWPVASSEWMIFLLLALIPTMLGHTVFNWSLKYVSPSVVSVCFLGEPVGAALLALFIFGEIPGMPQITGGVAILIGLYVFIMARARHERELSNQATV